MVSVFESFFDPLFTPFVASSSHFVKRLTGIALCCLFLLPLCLFYSRAGADILATLIGLLFLLYSVCTQQWKWIRQNWVELAALLCGLCLLSSFLSGVSRSWLQALCVPRVFLFVAALQCWLLPSKRTALWLERLFMLFAFWLISQVWIQYFTGHNIMGHPRWADGALTGPFEKPRASSTFIMLFFPGIMPSIIRGLHHQQENHQHASSPWVNRLFSLIFLAFCVVTLILIGQRMSTLFMLGGLTLTALLIPFFRFPFLLITCVAGLFIAALPFVSPPSYAKLVLKFIDQMQHFGHSDYGLLFRSATTMVLAHPWFGLGIDGFRRLCHETIHSPAFPWLGIPALQNDTHHGCNIHPHNYYLHVATSAGIPGLLVFCWLVLCWLWKGAKALNVSHNPRQAMLFVVCCVAFFPIASTSSFFSFPTIGWLCLSVGWLLASSDTSQHTDNSQQKTCQRT
ncbi:MAG: O-antigen ligase family protein [Acetobacter sp.]|nr:O-antigen ligase family protein [Acetobacter sp.]